jgi:hypothetical protein
MLLLVVRLSRPWLSTLSRVCEGLRADEGLDSGGGAGGVAVRLNTVPQKRIESPADNTAAEAPRDTGLGSSDEPLARCVTGSGSSDSSAFSFRPGANSHLTKLSAWKRN